MLSQNQVEDAKVAFHVELLVAEASELTIYVSYYPGLRFLFKRLIPMPHMIVYSHFKQ